MAHGCGGSTTVSGLKSRGGLAVNGYGVFGRCFPTLDRGNVGVGRFRYLGYFQVQQRGLERFLLGLRTWGQDGLIGRDFSLFVPWYGFRTNGVLVRE